MLVAMAICPACGTSHAAVAAPADRTLRAFTGELCVTKGIVERGAAPGTFAIADPTVRAVLLGSWGDAASIAFSYRGQSERARALASGQMRRQLGIKLRAANGCNVVYVMWRLDPRPELEISVKYNPGMRLHEECGANGYSKLKPNAPAPPLEPGAQHVLAAEIVGDELTATIDGRVAWRGALPESAREIHGPVGIRTDNVAIELSRLAFVDGKFAGACRRESSD